MDGFDAIDALKVFNPKLARRIVLAVLIAAGLIPGVGKWLTQAIVAKAESNAKAIEKPMQKMIADMAAPPMSNTNSTHAVPRSHSRGSQ